MSGSFVLPVLLFALLIDRVSTQGQQNQEPVDTIRFLPGQVDNNKIDNLNPTDLARKILAQAPNLDVYPYVDVSDPLPESVLFVLTLIDANNGDKVVIKQDRAKLPNGVVQDKVANGHYRYFFLQNDRTETPTLGINNRIPQSLLRSASVPPGDYTLNAIINRENGATKVTTQFTVQKCEGQDANACCQRSNPNPCRRSYPWGRLACVKSDTSEQPCSLQQQVTCSYPPNTCRLVGPPTPVFIRDQSDLKQEFTVIVAVCGSILFVGLVIGACYRFYCRQRGWGGLK